MEVIVDVKVRILKLLLCLAGIGWGSTIVGAVIPWEWATEHLETLGGSGPIPDDPMLNYWMRMASGAFGLIGVVFLLAAWDPGKYKSMLPVLGYGSVIEGCILLYYGFKFELPFFPFAVDVAIALIPGIGILMLQNELEVKDA